MAVNQVKAGAILNYIIIGLNTLTGLLYTPYMLRCLGQNEYGLYSLVASVIAYLTILDFGFGNAIIRYTAQFRAKGLKEEQWRMFGMFLIIYTIIGLIALSGGLILYFNVDVLFERTMTESDLSQARIMMLLLTLNLAVTFPLSIFGSIISAYENFVFQRVISISRILLSTVVMVVLLSVGFKAVAMVVVQTVFNILILLLNYLYSTKKLKIKIRFGKFDLNFIKEITVYSFWIFLNAIMDKIYWGTGQFVLGTISGTVAVAIFSVAILLENMYMSFSTSISNVLLPRITAMVTSNASLKSISDLFIRTGRIQCLILTLILSGFIIFGKGFIDVWAGKDYMDSYVITLIFFGALFIPLLQNTGISILQARNQMKFRSLLYLVISLVSLGMQIMLAKRYGPLGCAIAIGGALILGQVIIMNIYYAKKQGIDILDFWKNVLRMSICPALLTVIGIISMKVVDYTDPMTLCLGIIMYCMIYIPSIWKWSMNSYERELVMAPIKRMYGRLNRK